MKQQIAGRAFILHKGKVLLIRESRAYEDGSNFGKYDMPGGRIEPGERYEEGLMREVKEECGLSIEIKRPLFVEEWRPIIKDEQVQIIGIFSECQIKVPKIRLSKDHDDYQWIEPENYRNLPLVDEVYNVLKSYLSLIQKQHE